MVIPTGGGQTRVHTSRIVSRDRVHTKPIQCHTVELDKSLNIRSLSGKSTPFTRVGSQVQSLPRPPFPSVLNLPTFVIASAAKQSRVARGTLVCFATLAMTKCVGRNLRYESWGGIAPPSCTTSNSSARILRLLTLDWPGGGLGHHRIGFCLTTLANDRCKRANKNGLLAAIKSQKQLVRLKLQRMRNWRASSSLKLTN